MKRSGTEPPVLIQAADVLRRARRLPVGPAGNDLRQLARALVNLHKLGVSANVQIVDAPIRQ